MDHPWYRIAHRGAAGTYPEHTRPAFERALACGVDMIEFDVQLSRDGALVIMHDTTLERTTDGSGAVREHDWDTLKALDAGGWFGAEFAGQPPLCLQDVIDIVAGRAQLNIEIKSPHMDWEQLATGILEVLQHGDLLERTVVSCFDMDALAVMRRHSEAVRLGVLWLQPDMTEAWQWAERLNAVSVHPHWMLVSPEVTATAHQRGLEVYTWTANEVPAMQQLVAHGVDGIISDFPERFAEVEAGTDE